MPVRRARGSTERRGRASSYCCFSLHHLCHGKSNLGRAQCLKHRRSARRAEDFETTRAGPNKATAVRSMFTPLTERKIAISAELSIFLYNQVEPDVRFRISSESFRLDGVSQKGPTNRFGICLDDRRLSAGYGPVRTAYPQCPTSRRLGQPPLPVTLPPWQSFSFRLISASNATIFLLRARLRYSYAVARVHDPHYFLSNATIFLSRA